MGRCRIVEEAVQDDSVGMHTGLKLTGVALATKQVHSAIATGERVRVAGFWPNPLRLQLCPLIPAQIHMAP